MKIFQLTAKGRYYKTKLDGLEQSQHTTEREAIEASQELKWDNPDLPVSYTHEYEVDVALTNAGYIMDIGIGTQVDNPPNIISNPAPVFTEGTPNTYDMKQHVFDDGFSTVTYSLSNALPSGLTFNQATGILTYDGLGAASVSSHQLTATDAVGFSTSGLFNIDIQAASNPSLSWIGVPDPAVSFGYDPLTIARPANPAEWPSAENSSFYYIDDSDPAATDTGNTYGYPDQPRLTIPEGTFAAGTVILIGGGGPYTTGGDGRWQMTCNGTQSNQVWIVGEGVSKPELLRHIRVMTGSQHLIIDGLRFTQNNETIQFNGGGHDFMVIRNVDFSGPGTNVGNSSVLSMGGALGNPSSHYVAYNNLIENFGNSTDPLENDYHGFRPGSNATDIWIVNNIARNNGGDAIQVGSQSITPLTSRPNRVYIAGNTFSGDRENAVDVKDAINVIISQNDFSDYTPTNSSSGEIIVVHDDAEEVWIIGNSLYNGNRGVSCTSCINLYVVGNDIRDTNGTVDTGAPYHEPNTGVYVTGTSGARIVDNTFNNVQIGTQLTNGTSGTMEVSGNIYSSRQNAANGWDVMFESTTISASVIADRNLYESIRNRVGGTNYATLASWQAVDSNDLNAQEGAPLFTNEAANDFTLQATSPAVGNGAESSVYATFQTNYGINIRQDMDGNTRPTGVWDIGAHER